MFDRHLIVSYTRHKTSIAKAWVFGAHDINSAIELCRIFHADLKIFFRIGVGKSTCVAGDGEQRANHTIQGPSLYLSVHFGL